MAEIWIRILALCLALASVETLHGIFRTVVLAPRIGKRRALKLSVVTGSLLAFGVCGWMVPSMGLDRWSHLLGLGLLLSLFMASFDVALGRTLLKRPWRKILRDFDPRTGNLLLVGLCLLVTFPLLVTQLQRVMGEGGR